MVLKAVQGAYFCGRFSPDACVEKPNTRPGPRKMCTCMCRTSSCDSKHGRNLLSRVEQIACEEALRRGAPRSTSCLVGAHSIVSTRCARFAGAGYGSGQYSTMRTTLPCATVKKEMALATSMPSVTV